jgi:type II secretory pathway component PulF
MNRFYYTALDGNGKLHKEDGEFESVAELLDLLNGKGLTLVKCRKAFLPAGFDLLRKKMTRLELAEFFRDLALLLKGGIPLREALGDIVSGSGSDQTQLNRLFKRVENRLEDGNLFSESLAMEEKYIPSIIIPLVSIGEETGQLDQTLGDAARNLERVQEIISSTRNALIYPSFILLAMSGALIFWMVFVLPQMLELFATMGIDELPLATKILMASVDYFNRFWPLIPALIFVVFFSYLLSHKNEKLRYTWDLSLGYIPIIGTVLKSSQQAFFFEYTALLTSAGINIVRSLELMEESVQSRVFRKNISRIKEDVITGDSMSDAVNRLNFFEPLALRMIKVGEQTGNLPEQFKILADFYMKRVDKLVSAMSKTLEPFIIGVAGLVFMVIAMGLLGPIYNLISAIQ